MEKPIFVVLVNKRYQVFDFLVLVFVHCKPRVLDSDLVLGTLNITAANILVFNFFDSFEVEIVKAMTLSVPSVGGHNYPIIFR